MSDIQKAATLLAEARVKNQLWEALPIDCRPRSPEPAYEVQQLVVRRLLSEYGGNAVGYKIACTNKLAQEFLNLSEPFYGRLVSSYVYRSPARVNADDFHMRIIEPEFAFRMAEDLPGEDGPFSVEEVAGAVGAVLPAIEIVESRYKDWTLVGGPSLIADNGCNGAWVKGPESTDWKPAHLPSQKVVLLANGEEVREGRGKAIMGNPLNALTWLANMLSRQGAGLRAGELISTGTCVDVFHAQAGDTVQADFGPFGTVELTFEGARKMQD